MLTTDNVELRYSNNNNELPVIIHCPNCKQRYDLSDEYAGHNAECLDCGSEFTIPALDEQAEIADSESEITDSPEVSAGNNVKKSGIRIRKKAQNSDLLLSIISFCCCVAACAGIFYSTEIEFFLPAMVLLLLSFLLSLSDIYKKRLVPGLLVLCISLIVPGYVFPGKIQNGVGRISDMINGFGKDDNSGGDSKKDRSFWKSSLFEDGGAGSAVQDRKGEIKKTGTVTGAFGRRLGDVFEPSSSVKVKQIITGETLYQFTPDKPFRKFKNYYILITPVSKKIYAIWAETGLMSASVAEKEFKVMTAILENKYKQKSTSGVIPSLDRRELKISGRSVYLMSGFTGEVKLRYVDDDLEVMAEKEAVMKEAVKADASSL